MRGRTLLFLVEVKGHLRSPAVRLQKLCNWLHFFIFFFLQRVRSLLLTFFHISPTPEITFASSSLSPKRLPPPLSCLAGCAEAEWEELVLTIGHSQEPAKCVTRLLFMKFCHSQLVAMKAIVPCLQPPPMAASVACSVNCLFVVIGLLRIFRSTMDRVAWRLLPGRKG